MGCWDVRRMVSCVLLLGFPASVVAADSEAAMVHTQGAAWLNGTHLPSASAIFIGDLLQTRSDSAASISAAGTTIAVSGDSLVEFEGSSLKVEHGGVSVATSKGLATTTGKVCVTPASSAWTEFNVTDTNGTVLIAARKGDLTVTDDNGTVTLPQGQETTREEQTPASGGSDSKKKKAKSAATPAATGGILSSNAAIGVGGAAITIITVYALTRSPNPVSPDKP